MFATRIFRAVRSRECVPGRGCTTDVLVIIQLHEKRNFHYVEMLLKPEDLLYSDCEGLKRFRHGGIKLV